MRTFRTWAVDLEFNDGEKVTAYWDFKAGVNFWNTWGTPHWPAKEPIYDEKYKNMDVKWHSEVYPVDITVEPAIQETITVKNGSISVERTNK